MPLGVRCLLAGRVQPLQPKARETRHGYYTCFVYPPQGPTFAPGLPGGNGASASPAGASGSAGSRNVLVRLVSALLGLSIIVLIVVIGLPIIIGGVVLFFVIAIGLAIWVIVRAKVRMWLGLPPKPIVGARARAYRARRAESMGEALRENVRVRTQAASPATDAGGESAGGPPRGREIIDGEASPSREAP